jgi:hypothetical protein
MRCLTCLVSVALAAWIGGPSTVRANVVQEEPPDSHTESGLLGGLSVTNDLSSQAWSTPAASAVPSAEAPRAQGPVRQKVCETYELPAPERALSMERPATRDHLRNTDALVPDHWYYLECRWVDTGEVDFADRWQYDPADPTSGPDAETLAEQAYDQVPLAVPQPRTSPPADAEQLVGFPVWLWIDPAAWQPFEAEAAIPGLSVTVTATPRDVSWEMGDGTSLTCGPGTAWDPVRGANQATDCEHAYQFVGDYDVTATVTWSVAWEASNGESGTLADASRTASVPLTVTQRQAVVGRGGG